MGNAQDIPSEEIDIVVQTRTEHLRQMLLGTLGGALGLGFINILMALTRVSRQTRFQPQDFGGGAIAVLIGGSCWWAWRLLKRQADYERAANLYILGLLLGFWGSLLVTRPGPSVWREALPFFLIIVVSAAGLLLSPGRALLFTGLGMLGLLFFVGRYRFVLPVLVGTLISAAIANLTAGSLYTMAEHATVIYLRAKERANELFENREKLRHALAHEDWLNEELQETNAALERRAAQLQISSEVSRQASAILKLDTLLSQVVQLIRAQFGYYFVGIWLYDEDGSALMLRAGIRADDPTLLEAPLRLSTSAHSIVVDVFQRGESRLIPDMRRQPDYLPLDVLPATRSGVELPLCIGEQVLGVLDIQSEQRAAFDEEDRLVFQSLADQLAVAIRNAQLYGAEQARRQLAESLEETGRVLSSTLDLSRVTGRILDQLASVVPFERGAVLIREKQILRSIAQRGFPTDVQADTLTISLRAGDVFQQLVQDQAPLIIPDVSADDSFQQRRELALHHSWLGAPLISRDRVIGMLSLTRRPVGAFSLDDAQVVQAFAAQAAIALENARLYEEITQFNEALEQRVQERTEALNRAYERLERLDENKSAFIEVAAHELRTPLTVVDGYTQVMRMNQVIAEDPELRETLHGILSGTKRMHTVVNSMLDVARIDNESLTVNKRQMYVWEIFERIQTTYQKTLSQRQLSLEVEGLQALPHIKADPRLLYKAFDNLISNAVKYTPDGGCIAVGAVEAPFDSDGCPGIEVVVRDTGIGIAAEDQALIFEKFFQTGEVALHSSGRTKFKGGGPGLGLAIAKGVIEAHGGRIWVESPGRDEDGCPGSTFHVWLPRS
jgi:signal transduction histidine kinase